MEARKALYEPGNGTAYSAVAMRYRLGSCGGLGSVDDGWVVVSGLTCKAYLFQKDGGPLVDEYIKEKFGGLDGDYPFFGDLVRTLVDRSGSENVRQLLVIDPEEEPERVENVRCKAREKGIPCTEIDCRGH
ncbi:MAG: hypothetical protein V3V93_04045 [bacterium]